MFTIVRTIISLMFSWILAAVITKLKFIKNKKRAIILTIIFSLTVVSISLSFIPFENTFVTFKSAESAFLYNTYGKFEIEAVVEGTNCAYVFGSDSDSYRELIVPKKSNGYGTGVDRNTKTIFRPSLPYVDMKIFRYKNTKDCFVRVIDMNGQIKSISDSIGSEFVNVDGINKESKIYLAAVYNPDQNYTVTIDGKEYALFSAS